MISRSQRKAALLDALARFLGEHQAAKSIALEMEAARGDGDYRPRFAHDWAELLSLLGVSGYCTRETVRQALEELMGGK